MNPDSERLRHLQEFTPPPATETEHELTMNEEEIHRNLFAGVNSTPVQSLERRTLENETVAITVMPGTLFHSLTLIHPNPDTDLIVKLCTNLYAAWDRHQKAEPWSTISSVMSPAFCFYSEPP
jgi:hypothetical protein